MTGRSVLKIAATLEIPWTGPVRRVERSVPPYSERECQWRSGKSRLRIRVQDAERGEDGAVAAWAWSVECGWNTIVHGFDRVSFEHAWAVAEAHLRLQLFTREPGL